MSVRFTPSTWKVAPCVPLVNMFDCWPDSEPATLTRSIWTPGTVCMTTQGSRAVGIDFSSSLMTAAPVWTLRVSMTGVSPETVTVAATDESFIGIDSSVSRPRTTSTLSRLTVAKPCSASVIVYMPGLRLIT